MFQQPLAWGPKWGLLPFESNEGDEHKVDEYRALELGSDPIVLAVQETLIFNEINVRQMALKWDQNTEIHDGGWEDTDYRKISDHVQLLSSILLDLLNC